MQRPQQQQQQQIVRLPEPDQLVGLAVQGATRFAKHNPIITGTYLFGWIFLLLVGNGTILTVQQQREYNKIMNTIDLQAEYDASGDYFQARNAYYATKGWFTCDSLCQRNKARMDRAESILNDIRAEGAARMSDAKRTAGIFSEVGVGEIKDSFWQRFHAGKQFAKRQSMWDALFIGIRQVSRGRDESWIEYGLKILMQVLLNFSIGLCMALVFFVFGLWSIIRSYQTNPLVAVIVFCGAAAAGFAFVMSYLMAIFGAAGFSVYGLLKVAETSQRAQRLQNGGQRERVQYRAHYD